MRKHWTATIEVHIFMFFTVTVIIGIERTTVMLAISTGHHDSFSGVNGFSSSSLVYTREMNL